MKDYPSRPSNEQERRDLLKKVDTLRDKISVIKYQLMKDFQPLDDLLQTVRLSIDDGTYSPTAWPAHDPDTQNFRKMTYGKKDLIFINPASFLLAVEEIVTERKRITYDKYGAVITEPQPKKEVFVTDAEKAKALLVTESSLAGLRDIHIADELLKINPLFVARVVTYVLRQYAVEVVLQRKNINTDILGKSWHWSEYLRGKTLNVVPGATQTDPFTGLHNRDSATVDFFLSPEDVRKAGFNASDYESFAEIVGMLAGENIARTQDAIDFHDALRAKLSKLSSVFGLQVFTATKDLFPHTSSELKTLSGTLDTLFGVLVYMKENVRDFSLEDMRAMNIALELSPKDGGSGPVTLEANQTQGTVLKLSGGLGGFEYRVRDAILDAIDKYRNRSRYSEQ